MSPPKSRIGVLTLEHIDPRNGVLVSGLENEFNEILADYSYNSRKINRFVPYRVRNYSAPINEGDVGEFLIGGEWVVCEFMVKGGLWWQESNKIGNGCTAGGESRLGSGREGSSKGGKKTAKSNLEIMKNHDNTVEGRVKGGKKTCRENGKKNSKPVFCVETSEEYPSACEASKETGISRECIGISCRRGGRAGGLHWQFTNPDNN